MSEMFGRVGELWIKGIYVHHPQDPLTSNEDHLLGLAGAHGVGDGADEGGVEQPVH